MIIKEVFGLLAILVAFGSKVPYIHAIIKERKKPHIFTWIIWGITTSVVFAAQLVDGGGAGAWATGFGALICFFIAGLSYIKNPRLRITRSDWLIFIVALSSIPLWYITNDPLWSVIIVVAIDVTGYFPTLRKAYALPDEESSLVFMLQNLKQIFSIIALENYSVVTLLFPVTISLMNFLVPVTIWLGFKKQKQYL